ncbi:hypothetical protein [Micromonospora sp. NPDC004704]
MESPVDGGAAKLGCEFEVHEPAELRAYLKELGNRARRAAGAKDPG